MHFEIQIQYVKPFQGLDSGSSTYCTKSGFEWTIKSTLIISEHTQSVPSVHTYWPNTKTECIHDRHAIERKTKRNIIIYLFSRWFICLTKSNGLVLRNISTEKYFFEFVYVEQNIFSHFVLNMSLLCLFHHPDFKYYKCDQKLSKMVLNRCVLSFILYHCKAV